MGQGGGKAVATMLGIVGGAILGDHIEGGGSSAQNVQRCTTQTFYENRANGYSVVYEYGGKQYTVQMPNNPGPTVQLQVTPVGASTAAPAAMAPTTTYAAPATTYVVPATTVVEPQTVYVSAPVYYPGYYAPAYAPLGVGLALGLGIGYYGGHWGGGYHHWRR